VVQEYSIIYLGNIIRCVCSKRFLCCWSDRYNTTNDFIFIYLSHSI